MTTEAAETFIVRGRVQGVGFRWWTVGEALGFGLRGWVRNRRDGAVEVLAIGTADQRDALAAACRTGPSAARVDTVERLPATDDGSVGFDQQPTA